MEHDTYNDLGHKCKAKPHTNFKNIRVNFVYYVKRDGHHKARLITDVRLTDIPLFRVYSGAVSLKCIRLVMFLAELNGL